MTDTNRLLDWVETKEQAMAYGLYLRRQMESHSKEMIRLANEMNQLNENWGMGMKTISVLVSER